MHKEDQIAQKICENVAVDKKSALVVKEWSLREILDYLRYGELVTEDSNLLKGVKKLANHLGLTELVKELGSKGQLICKGLFGVIVSTKKPTKFLS